jgi:hypothetical protein
MSLDPTGIVAKIYTKDIRARHDHIANSFARVAGWPK